LTSGHEGVGAEVLLICGASGTGKTVTAWEVGHFLQSYDIPHAVIDTDELDRVWPQPEPLEALVEISRRNLGSIWDTYSDLGIRHLVLCGVIASLAEDQQWIGGSIADSRTTSVRLVAERTTREHRIRQREIGSGFEHDMAASDRAVALIAEHDSPDLPQVSTDDMPVIEVAREVLLLAGWLPLDGDS
jgi:ABC-type dipeptide/oligopeptide/nickel transport system ATPase component